MAQVAEAAHATRRERAVPSNSPVSSEPLGPQTLRGKAWDRLENDMRLTVFFMATIIVSSVAFILDTYFEDPEVHQVFFMIELVSVVIFTIEYCAKLACAPQPLKFALKFMSLVDLVAIVPFWIELAVVNLSANDAMINLSWVRVLRLFRVFRIFKVGKMTIGFKVVVKAIDMSVNSFSVLIFFMMILVVVSASLMYMAEGTEPPHPMQARPDLFRSIPDCMWWSVVTMTTVGYGDATPASPGGKVVAAFTMITGLLAIALPVSVLGQNFARVMDVYEDELRLNKGEDEDNDGVFSKDELRTFLFKKRAEGLLTRQFRVTTDDMMDRYDEDGKGYLTSHEFKKLSADIQNSLDLSRPPGLPEVLKRIAQMDERMARIEALLERALADKG